MGWYERLQRKLLDADPKGADKLRVAARRRRALERTGMDPAGAEAESLALAVRQARLGGLPESGNPATRVSVEAAWDRGARSPDEAPLLRARSTPIAELVADDLELQLREAMGVGFDGSNVSGVNEAVFEDVQRRIVALAESQPGLATEEAIRVLARRYGIDPSLPPQQLAEQLAGGLAGQNTSLFDDIPRRVIDSRLERVSDNPFPERPSSLINAPAADELFEPISTPMQFRVPRYEYDALGQVKLDRDGNPVARIDPETGNPTFEAVSMRQLLPYRTVDGQQFPVEAGEFTTIGRRRNSSDGNRSPETVAFVLDRGDGTYQLSIPTQSGYDSSIVDMDELGRVMVENGFGHIAGPDLGFAASGPSAGEAEALGRMLFDSMQPGAATPQQVAEVLQQLDALGDVFDGALLERALESAGFQDAGNELNAGKRLLGQALEMTQAEPEVAPAIARVRQAAQSPDPFSFVVQPPAALPSRGAGVTDAVGDAPRRARNLAAGQPLLTPAERAAQEVGVVSGPTDADVDAVSGPAAAEQFLGPDGQPITATANPAESVALALPPFELGGRFRPGVLSGISDVSASPELPSGPFVSPLAARIRRRQMPDLGTSSMSTGALPDGFALDTGTLPSTVDAVLPDADIAPERLDVLSGLSDVATPGTPVMNFQATPGSWADQVGGATVDVAGSDVVMPVDVADADLARRQFVDLSNRDAAARAVLQQFPGWEFTDDVGEIFRRMDAARAAEPAFADLDATEQFQMASMGNEELRALADDLAAEMAQTPNPNYMTQAQSVSAPAGGAAFDTSQNLPPVQLGPERAERVRQARGTTTSPDALYDITGRSLITNAQGWPAGTESWAAPPPEPAAPRATNIPEDGGSPPNETVFGFGRGNLEPDDADAPSRSEILRIQIDDARRLERVLARAEQMYETPQEGGFPNTPDQVAQAVKLQADFYNLPEGTRDAVLTALQSPDQVTAFANETIERAKRLSQALEQAEASAPRTPRRRPVADEAPVVDSPDNVTDITGARDSAAEELAESQANADFLASQRVSSGEDPRVSLKARRENVRRILGLQSGDEGPLAFRDYDSRFGEGISDNDIAAANRLQDWIAKYEGMDDAAYEALRTRNSDLPATRQEQIAALRDELNTLARYVASDDVQDADPSGANQSRLIQRLFSDDPLERSGALGELFEVEGLRDSDGNIVGDDGLAVLQMLANDPSYGSVEAVLYDVLSRDRSINDPEAAAGRIVDESGAEVSRAALGEKSLRSTASTLAGDVAAYSARRLSTDDLTEAGVPVYLPDSWGTPTPPEPPGAVRPSFVDRLLGRQPATPPAPEPQVVTRSGLDSAEQELAAATTPEEMNAVLARINHVRDRALEALSDATDPPVPSVARSGNADGVLSTPISNQSSARQAIIDKANELTDMWRRRMEQMQAAESSPVAGTVDSPVDAPSPDEPPVAAAARRAQAARSPGSFVPRGVSAELVARRAAEQAARQPQQMRNPANYTVFLPADQSEVVRDALNTRQQQLEWIDRRIAELETNPAAESAGDARWGRAGIEELRRARERLAVPAGTRDPQTDEVRIRFTDDSDEIVGSLQSPIETDDGLMPPAVPAGFVAIDFGPDGTPVLREKNVYDRRGQDPRFGDSTSAEPAPPAPDPAPETAPAARTDEEIIEEFSRPLKENLPYDSAEMDVDPDEARIDEDIEASLREPTPGPGRAAATREYEAAQARKAGKGQRRPLVTRNRIIGSLAGAGALGAGGVGVQTGLQSLGFLGGATGLGLAPMSAAYGEMGPTSVDGDINTLAEPAGSQVRQARRRLSYLTTQNPLPY